MSQLVFTIPIQILLVIVTEMRDFRLAFEIMIENKKKFDTKKLPLRYCVFGTHPVYKNLN